MKLSNALPLLALALPLVNAQIAGIAGTIDNSAEASSLQASADSIEEGSYLFTNAKTGQALHYVRDGNHITPTASSPSDATAVNVLHHGGGVPWVRLQIGDKDKCLSSQWGGSYNLAGVMYACAVDQGGAVTRLGNTLEPTKQWWLLVPVDSYDSSSSSHDNQALVAAQQLSVKTREKANSKRHLQPFGQAHHGLVARGSAPRRKTWADREDNSSSASKVTQTKTKSSSSKVKVAQKKQTSAAKPQSLAATSPSSSSSSSSESADGQRYFIIPTDHLIDMHTLALTGHEIESAGNTQSTALDAWDPSQEEQQWIITRA
ncbi:hypothetical protein BCR35DRAFT_349987 [Leucosporidium creatinivorum]|uniref:Ricin B lectin domain-containing protein n=1 Tax=Leucosporidium creatinivorum TaxID=106004 RepID=A0A1Y2G0S8_9BASI|nr:hypothetical protein BCR35DRAFT_349987 [Leucosporidium creatinivorum]